MARVFNVVAGHDPSDPYTEDGRGREEADYTSFLEEDGLVGRRLGVLRALVDAEDADSAVSRVFARALADLERLGAEVVGLDFDVEEQLARPNMFCGRFRYDMGVYLSSLGERAPITDVVEVLETGQYSSHAEGGLRNGSDQPFDIHPADRDPPCPDFFENEGRQAYRASLVAAMDADSVEAVLYPSWTHPPAHIDRGREEYRGDNSQRVAPATGMPAITVPMGYTYEGYPAGLQILGRPYAEGVLFRLAFAYEQGTDHRRPPPGFGELSREVAGDP